MIFLFLISEKIEKVYLYGFLLIETLRHGRYRKQHDIHAGIFQCGSPAFGMYASGIGNHQYFHNSTSVRRIVKTS